MPYAYTNEWHAASEPVWNQIFDQLRSKKALEIGSYEGRSAVFAIRRMAATGGGELHCLDTWDGASLRDPSQTAAIEQRFLDNIAQARQDAGDSVTVRVHKGYSNVLLPALLAETGQRASFDLVYVDGSHLAADVLIDLVYAYELCRAGGVIICDDYLWAQNQTNPTLTPKLAIDSFVNVFRGRLTIIAGAPINQLYLMKATAAVAAIPTSG